jgi:hypothetical protein
MPSICITDICLILHIKILKKIHEWLQLKQQKKRNILIASSDLKKKKIVIRTLGNLLTFLADDSHSIDTLRYC